MRAGGWLAVPFLVLFVQNRAGAQFGGVIDDLIDEVRQLAGDVLKTEEIGSAYAAIINFAGNPDVSTATYYTSLDNEVDAKLTVFRASLRHEFGDPGDRWRVFGQVLFPYQTLEYNDQWDPENQAGVTWDAFGAVGTLGFQYSVNTRFKITPAINLGSVRLRSRAGYRGSFAQTILAPAFSGFVYDWTADAVVFGGSLWMDYSFRFKTFDASFHGGVTHNWVQSYHVTDEAMGFFSYATTLSGKFETIHPTGVVVSGFPLSLVLSGGGTAFLGPSKDALGFDRFVNGGVALQADITRMGLPVRSLQLGAMGIVGPNVTGWSIIFNYEF